MALCYGGLVCGVQSGAGADYPRGPGVRCWAALAWQMAFNLGNAIGAYGRRSGSWRRIPLSGFGRGALCTDGFHLIRYLL